MLETRREDVEPDRGEGRRAFTEASLKGHPSAVFFGFTHCPEVCPTTLGDIGTWTETLGPEALALAILGPEATDFPAGN